MSQIHLLIIDPQNDFCDPTHGSLYVPGADKDMQRLARCVDRIQNRLSDIHVTLDSHHLIDIAHPTFWRDSRGNEPTPFTQITANDLRSGRWITRLPSARQRAINYLEELERNNRYPHTIWPPHCLIGSAGHNVYQPLFDSLSRWEANRFGLVDLESFWNRFGNRMVLGSIWGSVWDRFGESLGYPRSQRHCRRLR